MKLVLRHRHLGSAESYDSLIENRLLSLSRRRPIDTAIITVERCLDPVSPQYRVEMELEANGQRQNIERCHPSFFRQYGPRSVKSRTCRPRRWPRRNWPRVPEPSTPAHDNLRTVPFRRLLVVLRTLHARRTRLLALDLGVFHRDAHEVKYKEALTWSIIWISLALIFCFGLWKYAHWKLPQDPRLLAEGMTAAQAAQLADQTALEFLTGFVIEKSLSVDNIFVFVVVFSYFAIPPNTSTASCSTEFSEPSSSASSSSRSAPP
jgi:hypothetical protein